MVNPPASDCWKIADSGCWVWQRALQSQGYGVFRRKGRLYYAHRWSYEAHVGPIQSGLFVDHLCRNRACINPAHLEPVTPAENSRRARSRETHCTNGHPLTDGSRVRRPSGHVLCRACLQERTKRHTDRVGHARVYGTRLWWAIMLRDDGVCQYCGSVADTVDHVLPRKLGGSDEATNLVACCRSCNIEKRTNVWSPLQQPESLSELVWSLACWARRLHRYPPSDVPLRTTLRSVRGGT